MEFRYLGSSGVRVSSLCLGAMTFGEADQGSFMHRVGADQKTSFAILDAALAAGINFVDTADVYGQDGLSERVIGAWLDRAGTRDQIVLATKFRFTMGDGPNKSGASRYRIVRCCEDSLRRLKTDRIDLYQVHCQDDGVPEEETLRALDDLVSAGKVLYVGCSNYAAWRLTRSLMLAELRGWARYVTLQAQYSLVVRDLEREHVPLCAELGVGILPWSPLAAGFLTGKYDRDAPPPSGSRLETWRERLATYDTPRHWQILAAVKQIAAARGASPAAVSLAWLLARPRVTSVIFGARSVEQVDANVAAAELGLSAEEHAALDAASAIAPGYPYDMIARTRTPAR
jgi:aryl-alcohol dehydrogenase-like predicted oxidoreductase